MEKQKITVRVAGKSYTLVSSDPPEHVRRVAELVDRRLREMEIASSLPMAQVLTLTCLNLEDQLVKAQDEIQELKRRLALAETEGARGKRRRAPAEAEKTEAGMPAAESERAGAEEPAAEAEKEKG